MKLNAATLVLLVSMNALGADPNSWPEFRGPTTQGLSKLKSVPVRWDAQSNVVWKVEIPGGGWSSPVVQDKKIFLTTAIPGGGTNPLSLHALCYQLTDGKLVWDVEVFQSSSKKAQQKHDKNSLASPTPIISKDKVFVHFGPMGTAALDLSGKILWRNADVMYPPVHGNGGSPALVKGNLIFSCDGERDPFVIALDASTGKEKWRTPRNTTAKRNFSFSTPLVTTLDGVEQVISPGSGFIAGYNPATGQELWKVGYGEGYSVVPRPLLAHGNLYIGTGFDRAWIYAIKAKGLKGDCTESHVLWKEAKGAPHTPSLLMVGDELYAVSDAGIATCFDARTGKTNWSERLGGNFSSSPIAVGSLIYFMNEAGTTFVVKADPKEFKIVARNDLGERLLASPAVIQGAIIIRTDGHLWRIGK